MTQETLGLYRHILPALRDAARDEPEQNHTDFAHQFEAIQGAVVFDCRRLPEQFVDDTGQAAFHEQSETNQVVRLPFATCYFEFADEGAILAYESNHGIEGTTVSIHAYAGFGSELFPDALDGSFGEFYNGVNPYGDGHQVGFLGYVNCDNPVCEAMIDDAAKRLIGILALLHDHLLATEVRPDPAPNFSVARVKRGRLPLSGPSRVLTINVGAIRRVAVSPAGSHESPRLHWRRGHWRTLHRGSEFESKTWVKRCLVGDPRNGFVHKDYRLIWSQPMIRADKATAGMLQ